MWVRLLPWLSLASLAFLTTATAAAAGLPGSCVLPDGTPVAPWTDPVEPACGEDCGPADEPTGVEDTQGLCSTTDAGCGVQAPVLEMPAPQGPRCLEADADCGPRDPAALNVSIVGAAHAAAASAMPRRGVGTLPHPAADPPQRIPPSRTLAVEVPPPR